MSTNEPWHPSWIDSFKPKGERKWHGPGCYWYYGPVNHRQRAQLKWPDLPYRPLPILRSRDEVLAAGEVVAKCCENRVEVES